MAESGAGNVALFASFNLLEESLIAGPNMDASRTGGLAAGAGGTKVRAGLRVLSGGASKSSGIRSGATAATGFMATIATVAGFAGGTADTIGGAGAGEVERSSITKRLGLESCDRVTSAGRGRSKTMRVTPGSFSATRI